ncbi:XRE family transcriptional regulator [Mucilaginibacter conchicola]|uniref:XRE family transcriptional regulator n=1 Tax=Mucilaginibacter conchicola TaxID=2303333 RepID=A0A372NQQ1_9SPHI|nr:helix-turn-helix transcriptional regulator [Mucilaginibacter conchicola]RFZ91279.1 XRE family transcriptional regulator [Mucilaginibacter conchicola]
MNADGIIIKNQDARNLVSATIFKIQKIRIEKKISQRVIADALGVSQNAYSKIEQEHTRLQLETLFIISKVLEVEILELLDFNHIPKSFKEV